MKMLVIGIALVVVLLFFFILPYTGILKPSYTIQDIHHWCCNNLDNTISPTGDNCSNVINNIYGGDCYGD